ncbi:uncharacterized protein LOC115624229 [Scaptodrosophila lebanonensis]|uniref:Uncharacterized protein LOC115624229 n=1 Tax=Drosophila lebanonensis TaxID=7225 RepID=A0A6J2TFD6_DROLE|nr:uncharacterized protein LOC115624229 [Scaptodrosophila lebanonensis]
MLRSRLLNIPRRYVSYLSSEFNSVVNRELVPPVAHKGQQPLNLDVFVKQENRQMDILEILLKLRKQKESTSVPLFPSILAKQLLESASLTELVTVLRNPLEYGVFIDQFTGCFLMDHLLHHGNSLEAGQIAAILVERDLCNSDIATALALRSFYNYLQVFEPTELPAEKPVTSKADVEKVRVKYLRNYAKGDPLSNTEEMIMSRALIKLGEHGKDERQLKQNFALLGFVLGGQMPEMDKLLSQHKNIFYKEILELCETLIGKIQRKETYNVDMLQEVLKGCTRIDSIQEVLESNIKLCVHDNESKLIADHVKQYDDWAKNYEVVVKQQLNTEDLSTRVENISKILSEMEAKRQNLWFFEKKDEIDIQIFKQKVFYPKRWFGKKKKPKVVDKFYVPPNITRTS